MVKKNTAKKERINSFGFYSINGKSVYSSKESSKKEDVIDFLHKIRENNPNRKLIILADNFASHKSKKVKEVAKELNITIIFLPVYSPDLNPIEFIWKSIKKYISSIAVMCKDELKEVVEKLFYKLASSLSFARNWIKKFLATD